MHAHHLESSYLDAREATHWQTLSPEVSNKPHLFLPLLLGSD